jgi:hypothetical protein
MAKKKTPPSPRNAKKKSDDKAARKALKKTAKAHAKGPPMSPLEIDTFLKEAGDHPLHAARGHAIQSYANLEQSLCRLFVLVSGTTPDVAGVIFFKITSTAYRDKMLARLVEKKYGNKYEAFWESLGKLIAQITQRRNEIVHWSVAMTIDAARGTQIPTLVLPNIYDWLLTDKAEPPITTEGLIEFKIKCDTITRLCNMFQMIHKHSHWPAELMKTWLDIFQKPVVYPMPEGHPLFQKKPKPESQPPSSQESPESPPAP